MRRIISDAREDGDRSPILMFRSARALTSSGGVNAYTKRCFRSTYDSKVSGASHMSLRVVDTEAGS